MLRAIVFDAVGTLITPDPPAATAYYEAGLRHGSRRPLGHVRRCFAEALRDATRRRPGHRTDEAAERDFWRSVVESVFDDLPPAALTACFDDLFTYFASPSAWHVYPDVRPALATIRNRRLTLAVASNFDARLHEVFCGHPELQLIECRFVSSELGWRKPHSRFFAAVCERLGCSADELLYVGDEPQDDVAGAAAAGLHSLLISRDEPPRLGSLSSLDQLPALLDPTRPSPSP